MAISKVNAVASAPNANTITCTSANTLYQASVNLDPAIYTISCVSTTVAKIEFYSGETTVLATGTTSSGTTTVNLGTAADRVRVWTDTGSNVNVTIAKTAVALTNNFSGTLDTITASGTYTGTSASGYAFVVVVGGGGGGSNGVANGGAGGGSGGVGSKIVALTGSMPVTIGNAGNANTSGAAGASIFAGMTANGGNGAQSTTTGQAGGTVTGATYNVQGPSGGNGGGGPGGPGSGGYGGNPPVTWSFVASTIGASGTPGSAGGGGGAAGTGYGAGGSGGSVSGPGPGAAGRPGVVYVLRY